MGEQTYVTLIEVNHKHNESTIYYLQYNGNKKELRKLSKLFELADFSEMEMGQGHSFMICLDVVIPESAVIPHMALPWCNRSGNLLQMVSGKCRIPEFDTTVSSAELAECFYDKFVRKGSIAKCFTE